MVHVYIKYYKSSNESCTFLFLGRLGHYGKVKSSQILLQYPTFESVYFHIFIVPSSVHTKMSKMRKSANYIKCTVLSQNRLAHKTYFLCQSVRLVFIVLGIYNFEGKKHKI